MPFGFFSIYAYFSRRWYFLDCYFPMPDGHFPSMSTRAELAGTEDQTIGGRFMQFYQDISQHAFSRSLDGQFSINVVREDLVIKYRIMLLNS